MKTSLYTTNVGKFEVEAPMELVVQDELEWKLTYTAVEDGIKPGGSLKIVVPAYQHQRTEEYLQCYDYWKPNYIYALGQEDDIRVDIRVEKVPTAFSHIKKWPDSSRIAIVTLENGLKEGETIYVKFAGIDRPWIDGECSPTRVGQHSFKKEGTYLDYKVAIDKNGNGNYEEVEAFPRIKIIPDKPKRIVLTAPSLIREGEVFKINVNVVDRFSNPIFDYDYRDIVLEVRDLTDNKQVSLITYKDNTYKGIIEKEGFYEITVKDSIGLSVEKAVVMCKNSEQKIYWGDIHIHSNLTANIRDNDGGASPKVGYQYAKGVSRLDFVCISEQTFAFNEDRSVNIDKATWKAIGEEADKYYEEGELVTFPGFEFHSERGDTIVLFKESLSNYPYPSEEVKDIPDVWNYYNEKDHLTIPHFHRYCGGRNFKDQQETQYSGFDLNNWELSSDNEVLAEVFSSQWGRFEYTGNPMVLKARSNVKNNTYSDFLNRGKSWGITASSDGHDGNPGYGGVTAVYANGQTREEIFNGLSSRRTIASTHPRVTIDYSINDYQMGDVISGKDTEKKIIHLSVVAPDDIKHIEIIKNGHVFIKKVIGRQWVHETFSDLDILLEDTYYYVRVTLQNGHIAWTSPIWFEKECKSCQQDLM